MPDERRSAGERGVCQSSGLRESLLGRIWADASSPASRNALAGAIYHMGGVRILERIARSYEIEPSQGETWLRFRRTGTAKFLILCYHRVGTRGVPLYSKLAPSVFEAQMRYLKKRYTLVSLNDLRARLQDSGQSGNYVSVTFDDGYRDLYRYAFPVLQKYQIPATVFLIAEAMETGQVAWYDRIFLALQVLPAGKLEIDLDQRREFWLSSPGVRMSAALQIMTCLRRLPNGRRKQCCADLEQRVRLPREELSNRILTWEQACTMQRGGVVFGSHSLTHPVLSRTTPDEMEKECRESKEILEARLKTPVTEFAFPFGHYEDCGKEAPALLAKCGYRTAVTTIERVNTPGADPFALGRSQIDESANRALFALRINQSFLMAGSHGLHGGATSSELPLEAEGAHRSSPILKASRHA